MKRIKLWFENKVRKIIKKSNENWFSFLSGVCANIPVSLFLMFEKVNTSVWGWIYFGLFLFTFIVSIFLIIFEFKFTIKVIEIKGKAKDKYEQYLRTISSGVINNPVFYEDPNMQEIMLNDECDKNLNKLTRIALYCLLLCFFLVMLILFLWILKNFIQ